jgi:hypothetical protein
MPSPARLLAAASALLGAAAAFAQAAPPPKSPGAPPAASAPSPSAAAAPAPVPAQAVQAEPASGPRARFDAARERFVRGEFDEAARALDAVAVDPAAPPALAEAARALADAGRELVRRGRFVLRDVGQLTPPSTPGLGLVDRTGRGELVWFSTLLGIWVADGLAIVGNVDDGKAYLALTIAGSAVGLGTSLGVTRRGSMSSGRASTISSAFTWSSVNAATLAAIAETSGDDALAATIGAGLLGVGVSAGLTRHGAPSIGDVTLVNSAGWWGLVAGALSLTFTQPDDGRTVGWTLLAGADAGLIAGALLADRHDVSRGRTLVVDAGGLLGGLVGVAIPVFSDATSPEAYGGAALAGIAAGLAVGHVLTKSWDAPASAADAAAPVRATPVVSRLADGTFTAGIAAAF